MALAMAIANLRFNQIEFMDFETHGFLKSMDLKKCLPMGFLIHTWGMEVGIDEQIGLQLTATDQNHLQQTANDPKVTTTDHN